MRNYDPVKHKAYYDKNVDRMRANGRRHYYAHKDIYNEKSKARRKDKRIEIVNFLGGKCVVCGWSDVRALNIDHVNGGGRADREQYGNIEKFYDHIREVNGVGYQILCANHNQIKKYENGEHAWVERHKEA